LALNSPSRVESLSFNPFTLTLTALNIAVPYPGDAGMFLRMDRLEAVLSFSSLFRLAPKITELKLDRPVIKLILFEDETFSPQLFFGGQDAEPPGKTAVFPCVVENFSITNGTVIFSDHRKDTTHIVEKIELAVPFASTLPADQELAVTPRLSATVNGRPVSLAGETRPFSKTLRTEFTLRTEELALDRFREYIAPYTTLELKSAALSTSLTLRLSREEGEAIRFHLASKTKIRGLELAGPQGAVLRAAGVDAEMEIRPGMRRIVINDLFLDSPAISARRAADGSIDWQNFFAAPKQDADAAPPPALAVTSATIANGVITWHDATVPGFAPRTIQNIRADFANFDSQGEGKADFRLECGEGAAKFPATGTASVKPLRIEGSVDMDRLPIPLLSPYLGRMTDMSLDGALGLKGSFAVEHGARTLVRLGEISLYDMSATLPGSRTPLLTAKLLAAGDIRADMSARGITVGTISATGVTASPVRGKDGNFMLGGSAKQDAAPLDDWQTTIGSVQIHSANIILTDHSLHETAVLPFSEARISASALSTRPGAQWTAEAAARPGKHGLVRLEARGAFNPLDVSFRFRADRADIVFLSPYIKRAARLSLSEGLLHADVNGQIKTGRSGRIRIDAAGDAGLHGVSLTGEGKEIVGWGRLRAEKFRYRNVPRNSGAFSAETVILNGPRVSVTIGEDGTSNMHHMLFPSSASSTRTPSAGPGISLSVGGARVTSGEIRLRDERLQPPHPLKVENIRMDMGKVSSDPAERGEFSGSLRLNGSPIAFDGAINPLSTPFAGELAINIWDLDLAAFSRYAAQSTGYPIRRGELSAQIELALNGLDVNGRSELVLSRLEMGDRDPLSDAPDMPIRTAISLLRDLSGDITLSLPVSGRLGDPQFHIGGVVGKAVINTMLKTVATPVRLIGGFFRFFLPATRQERINFPPGEARITERMANSLDALVASLPRRGRVRLELIGAADMREKPDMIMAEMVKKMRKAKYDALPEAERAATAPDRVRVGLHVDAEEYARLLRAVYANWPEKPEGDAPKSAREMMRVLRGGISVSDNQVSDLAEARARAVRDELVRIDESLGRRITVGASRVVPGDSDERRLASCVQININ
ncbi:MAG: DUF748 domain-containing protein, partial [Deltaproteobacteria bacterium]|nr:DUF748 domain-containing protein [Deltaproteobacteria bacterium]